MGANCLFCNIVKGTIPALKVFENELTLAFLDINPLSKGHVLVIPKAHGQFLHQIPDENLSDILPVVKKIARVIGGANYNVLQNNGRLAHQAVDHVHFHIIPKTENAGLGIDWNQINLTKGELEGVQKLIVDGIKK